MTEDQYRLILIKKISQNRLTSQESKELADYKDRFDPDGNLKKSLVSIWNTAHDPQVRFDSRKVIGMVGDRIYQSRIDKTSNLQTYIKAAASIIIILGLGALIWFPKEKQEPIWMTANAQAGQIKTITLSDGSTVKLKPNAKVKYPEYFMSTERLIHIDGEAFLEVAKDSKRPFKVETGNVRTTVLGTSFSVAFESLSGESRVAVLEGKVKVESATHSSFLHPMEAIDIRQNSNYIVISKLTDTSEFDWREGVLNFDDQPLDKVFREVEKWYGVQFKINSENVRNCRFTGKYKRENLQVILKSIIEANQLVIAPIGNKHYEISGPGCEKR